MDIIDEIEAAEVKAGARLYRLCERINAKKGLQRVEIRHSRQCELLTEAEATVRELCSYFAVSCNAGTLFEELEWGRSLIPQLKAIGASGCAQAIHKLTRFAPKFHRLLYELDARGEELDYEEYHSRELAIFAMRGERESSAEGDQRCDELLWEYAKQQRAHILAD